MKQRFYLGLAVCASMLSPFLSLIAPYTAYAQAVYGSKDDLQGYLVLIMSFLNYVLLPLIFSIALLFFLINAARYFIIDGEEREKARTMALYGIAAFVILVSLWGIVNMLVGGLGIDDSRSMCPDYLQDWCMSNSIRGGDGGNGGFSVYGTISL